VTERNPYYYDEIDRFVSENVPEASRVCEVECEEGALRIAQAGEIFDHILMIDILDHVYDIWEALKRIGDVARPGTFLYISTINPVWQPLFNIAEALKLKRWEGAHNFIRTKDMINLLQLFDYSIVKREMRLLIPVNIPWISGWINRWIPRIPFLRNFCVIQALVVRKEPAAVEQAYSCSVVIPCHNEEENVEACAGSIPQMGKGTEVIFVNDGSKDGTEKKLQMLSRKYPHVRVVSYPVNKGKGQAVQEGFKVATGDILMIYDADLTVPATDLHQFYYALAHHKARFVNGSRLVYPLEKDSMRTANLWGNQFFGMLMSWLIGQRVTDTLCGTKAFFKKDYPKMKLGKDKWGDFDYLFSTAELNLRLVEIPIHYKSRQSGASKMKTFQHGLLLMRVCLWGFFHIKLKSLFEKASPRFRFPVGTTE